MLSAGAHPDGSPIETSVADDEGHPRASRRVSLHKTVVGAFILDSSIFLVSGLGPIASEWIKIGAAPPTMSIEVVLLAYVLFLACQFLVGAYKSKQFLAHGRPVRRTALSLFVAFSLIFVLGAAAKVTSEYSRLWLFSWMTVSFIGINAVRWLVLEKLQSELARGGYVHRAASVGVAVPPLTEAEIKLQSKGATRVFHKATLTRPEDLQDLDAIVRDQHIDEVFLTVPWERAPSVFDAFSHLQHISANVHICLRAKDRSAPFLAAQVANGSAQLKILDRPIDGWNSSKKRAVDLALAYLALLLLWPLMLLTAAAIKLDSRGPVLFRQPRQGFNGRTIEVLKFRSMRDDQTDLYSERQTSRDDSRVTRVGRFIRRTSIDELPQIFNVIRGDMSIVGPRPHAIKTTAAGQSLSTAIDEYAMRHRVKPGITGWAQVNGLRGELDTIAKLQRRVEHDIYYIRNWSLAFDLTIVLRTLALVAWDRKAY